MTAPALPLVTSRGDGMIEVRTEKVLFQTTTPFQTFTGEPTGAAGVWFVIDPDTLDGIGGFCDSATEDEARTAHSAMVERVDAALARRMEGCG